MWIEHIFRILYIQATFRLEFENEGNGPVVSSHSLNRPLGLGHRRHLGDRHISDDLFRKAPHKAAVDLYLCEIAGVFLCLVMVRRPDHIHSVQRNLLVHPVRIGHLDHRIRGRPERIPCRRSGDAEFHPVILNTVIRRVDDSDRVSCVTIIGVIDRELFLCRILADSILPHRILDGLTVFEYRSLIKRKVPVPVLIRLHDHALHGFSVRSQANRHAVRAVPVPVIMIIPADGSAEGCFCLDMRMLQGERITRLCFCHIPVYFCGG